VEFVGLVLWLSVVGCRFRLWCSVIGSATADSVGSHGGTGVGCGLSVPPRGQRCRLWGWWVVQLSVVGSAEAEGVAFANRALWSSAKVSVDLVVLETEQLSDGRSDIIEILISTDCSRPLTANRQLLTATDNCPRGGTASKLRFTSHFNGASIWKICQLRSGELS